jgi:trypsin
MKQFVTILSLLVAFEISNCSPIDNSPLVVGGTPARIEDFPFSLALLDMVRGGATGFMCGASNINRLYALSAAHCLQFNTPPESIHLYGGSTSRLRGGRKFFVTRYILHPNYSRLSLDNDVAVLQVLVSLSVEFCVVKVLNLDSGV